MVDGMRCAACAASLRAESIPQGCGTCGGTADALRYLRECDFAVIDASLFCGMNPASAEAREYLEQARAERSAAAAAYEKQFGALTIYGEGRPATVTPWKYEAN